MTISTLEFQPEAERYYAQGYWQDGDLWSDFDARSREHAARVALVLEDRAVTYAQLRRAAVALSHRLADAGVGPGEVVILLGRHSIEAAVAMLGCLHLGVVLAPLPPMFNPSQLTLLIEQTRARAIVTFGGEKEIAKCREVSDQVPALLIVSPELVDTMVSEAAPPERDARHADDLAMVMHSSGTTSAPKGIAHSSNTMR
jgi:acyl-coenzyme A synthetase/AMP-(fatty) acid ligase